MSEESDSFNEKLKAVIDEMTPRCLDDIIRENRELAELRMATDADIQGVPAEIEEARMVTDAVENWRLITLYVPPLELAHVLLLGKSEKKKGPVLSSKILEIDLNKGLVGTESGSLYKLGKPGAGEPPTEHLVQVCATLHFWGSGEILGVPTFI
ncbi:hypothetical protein [Sulfurirhabdus autotrophica]|uniref:Uncharacterized protein n=1 Tax=Sulfurirhabdus autotrophica TaxID=1706046 RepID=A0A4R3XWD1_9PROT|nr:hypothetical protein [Sulfurirhabdus autotrophica]TCV81079.1 hypothetical protein EDC63_12737 [Sulfurirhabdus autotrophica]